MKRSNFVKLSQNAEVNLSTVKLCESMLEFVHCEI